jgi:hypothetical protein
MGYRAINSFGGSIEDFLMEQARAGCENSGGVFYADVARCDCGGDSVFKDGGCTRVFGPGTDFSTPEDIENLKLQCVQAGGSWTGNLEKNYGCDLPSDCRGSACPPAQWNPFYEDPAAAEPVSQSGVAKIVAPVAAGAGLAALAIYLLFL